MSTRISTCAVRMCGSCIITLAMRPDITAWDAGDKNHYALALIWHDKNASHVVITDYVNSDKGCWHMYLTKDWGRHCRLGRWRRTAQAHTVLILNVLNANGYGRSHHDTETAEWYPDSNGSDRPHYIPSGGAHAHTPLKCTCFNLTQFAVVIDLWHVTCCDLWFEICVDVQVAFEVAWCDTRLWFVVMWTVIESVCMFGHTSLTYIKCIGIRAHFWFNLTFDIFWLYLTKDAGMCRYAQTMHGECMWPHVIVSIPIYCNGCCDLWYAICYLFPLQARALQPTSTSIPHSWSTIYCSVCCNVRVTMCNLCNRVRCAICVIESARRADLRALPERQRRYPMTSARCCNGFVTSCDLWIVICNRCILVVMHREFGRIFVVKPAPCIKYVGIHAHFCFNLTFDISFYIGIGMAWLCTLCAFVKSIHPSHQTGLDRSERSIKCSMRHISLASVGHGIPIYCNGLASDHVTASHSLFCSDDACRFSTSMHTIVHPNLL